MPSLENQYDVLFIYNDADKRIADALKFLLQRRNLRSWTKDELRPGIPWQDEFAKALKDSRSVAVLIGADGLVPWEKENTRAALNQAVEKDFPIIPVFLATAPESREVPPFLGNRTPVNLSASLSPEDLDRLVYGITGDKQEQSTVRSFGEAHSRKGSGHGRRRVEFSEILDSASKGNLRPFVGSLCYADTTHLEPALGHFNARLTGLKDAIKPQEYDFICSVAKSRIPPDAWQALKDATGGTMPPPTGLYMLQGACAEIGLVMSEAIGVQMTQQPQGITTLGDFEIHLSEDKGHDILARISKASNLAHGIDGVWFQEDALRLKDVGCSVQPCNYPCFAADGIKARMDALYDSLQKTAKEGGMRFTLGQFEWIGDLLWQTLRFDAPMMPDTDDLTFQLSLGVGTRPFCKQRPHLGDAAASADQDGERIARWLDCYGARGLRATNNSRSLYSSLAQFLQYSPDEAPEGYVPMLINSNIDLGVEILLQDVECTHNVLFPVFVKPKGYSENVSGDPRWMILTRRFLARNKVVDTWLLLSKKGIWSECSKQLKEGPLIVKLRGSPCHPRPPRAQTVVCVDEGVIGEQISHAVYLSDVHFFDYMLKNPVVRLPDFLIDLLRGDKTWCLLGYPLPDPHLRLAFHDHVRHRREAALSNPLIFVDYPPDPFHEGLVEQTNVQYLEMSLSNFASKLNGWLASKRSS